MAGSAYRLSGWQSGTGARFCKNRVPQIQLVEPEGTYLAWLDCRELGMTDDELMAFFSNEARYGWIRARIRVNRDLDLCALIWAVRAV